MTETTQLCPDPECINGEIVVYNAYSADPLKGEVQKCDACGGTGTVERSSAYNQ